MKKTVKTIIALILISVMSFSFVGCNNDKKDIENLILEFEYACNTLDFDAVLNCIDPKISDNIKLAGGLLGMFTETNTDQMFDELSQYLLDNTDLDGGSSFFSTIKIEVEDIEIEGVEALVTTRLKFNVTGEEMERVALISCIYYTEKWYLSNFSIQ